MVFWFNVSENPPGAGMREVPAVAAAVPEPLWVLGRAVPVLQARSGKCCLGKTRGEELESTAAGRRAGGHKLRAESLTRSALTSDRKSVV